MLPVIGFLIAEQSFGRYRNDTRLNTCFRQFSRPFHEGSFKIAERANAYIVPVAIYGADDVLENHFPAVHPSAVTIAFGKPFRASELPPEMKKKTGVYTAERIREMLVEEEKRRA